LQKEKTIRVYVKSVARETDFVKKFTIASLDGKPLPKFSGGAHIATYLEAPQGLLVRYYSLASCPDDPMHYQIAVRLSDRSNGGSEYWHRSIQAGDELEISYPKNHFPLSFKAKHHVFYAAGIGITPFISMMHELRENGSSFELHYASKSKEACVFFDFLQREYPNESNFYFSQHSKRITPDLLKNHRMGTHVYFCGPESFIAQLTDAAVQLGYPECSIHSEQFTPPQPKNQRPFSVQLTDGSSIYVNQEQTLLHALLSHGVQAPFSCQVGRCGTCELEVAEGEVTHYDSFLTEEQKDAQSRILTCVSRAKSDRIVLKI
jgi:ferredoxin-NADP reductase